MKEVWTKKIFEINKIILSKTISDEDVTELYRKKELLQEALWRCNK